MKKNLKLTNESDKEFTWKNKTNSGIFTIFSAYYHKTRHLLCNKFIVKKHGSQSTAIQICILRIVRYLKNKKKK